MAQPYCLIIAIVRGKQHSLLWMAAAVKINRMETLWRFQPVPVACRGSKAVIFVSESDVTEMFTGQKQTCALTCVGLQRVRRKDFSSGILWDRLGCQLPKLVFGRRQSKVRDSQE